ncbi:MAG: biopolymer transporter ExbD [Hyphomicrobiales bacterium]|nr:biopolymer transporter ExbD [Hyphomicrobiales bacterium]
MIRLPSHDPHDGMLRDLAPDLTPMLDILFILLVFFMLTAGVVLQALDVRLPAVADDAPLLRTSPQQVVLELHPDFYVLNGARVQDFAALRAALASLQLVESERDLIIAGDERVAMGRLLQLLTHLRAEGIESTNIVMRKETN